MSKYPIMIEKVFSAQKKVLFLTVAKPILTNITKCDIGI